MVAKELCDLLKPDCQRLIVAGSLRRKKAEVGDVEVLFVPKMLKRAIDFWNMEDYPLTDLVFERMVLKGIIERRPKVDGTFTWGKEIKLARHVKSGIPVDFFAARQDNWFSMLVCRTGSGRSNIAICQAAQRKGWKWTFTQGFRNEVGRIVPVESEEDVFRLVGLKYLHPWERE